MGEWGTGRRDCWPPGTAATAARGVAAAGCAVTAAGQTIFVMGLFASK